MAASPSRPCAERADEIDELLAAGDYTYSLVDESGSDTVIDLSAPTNSPTNLSAQADTRR